MEKVTITVPAQYERILLKVLEIIELEKEGTPNVDVENRKFFAKNNIDASEAKFIAEEYKTERTHTCLSRAAAHLILALEQIEKGA